MNGYGSPENVSNLNTRRGKSAGKVITLPAREVPVRWYLDVCEEEGAWCNYRGENESFIHKEAHWSVVVQGRTIERLQELIEKAKEQLAREKAVRAAADRQPLPHFPR